MKEWHPQMERALLQVATECGCSYRDRVRKGKCGIVCYQAAYCWYTSEWFDCYHDAERLCEGDCVKECATCSQHI